MTKAVAISAIERMSIKSTAAGHVPACFKGAMPVGFIAVFIPKLLGVDDAKRTVFHELARVLIEAMGAVQVTVDGRPWLELH